MTTMSKEGRGCKQGYANHLRQRLRNRGPCAEATNKGSCDNNEDDGGRGGWSKGSKQRMRRPMHSNNQVQSKGKGEGIDDRCNKDKSKIIYLQEKGCS